MIHEAIYRVGRWYWNRGISERYRFLLESQRWCRERLLRHQAELLRELLVHAQRASPYYRELMARCGVDPFGENSLDQLQRLPVLEKESLAGNLPAIQNSVPGQKHFRSETSGSTGRPLVFRRNADWDAWHRASALRGYSWHAVGPWERSGYLWGYNFSPARRAKMRVLDYLQNRFRMFSYQQEEMDVFLDRLRKASYLAGYSSMIYELARRKNLTRPDEQYALRMIKGTSEKIYDHYQGEVQRAFGGRIVSEYGSAECGIISFESPCGKMHVNMETVVVEEQGGEIVVTNLVSKSLPIIRYRLGDYVTLVDEGPCVCGLDRPVIKEVLGRVGKTLYGKEGRYPSLVLYYIFKNMALSGAGVLNYQAVQKRKGQVVLRIEEELSGSQGAALRKEIARYFGDDMDVSIVENERIISTNRKRVDFVSELAD